MPHLFDDLAITLVIFFFTMFPVYKFSSFVSKSILKWKKLTYDDNVNDNIRLIFKKFNEDSNLIYYGQLLAGYDSTILFQKASLTFFGAISLYSLLIESFLSWRTDGSIYILVIFLISLYIYRIFIDLRSANAFIAITDKKYITKGLFFRIKMYKNN